MRKKVPLLVSSWCLYAPNASLSGPLRLKSRGDRSKLLDEWSGEVYLISFNFVQIRDAVGDPPSTHFMKPYVLGNDYLTGHIPYSKLYSILKTDRPPLSSRKSRIIRIFSFVMLVRERYCFLFSTHSRPSLNDLCQTNCCYPSCLR